MLFWTALRLYFSSISSIQALLQYNHRLEPKWCRAAARRWKEWAIVCSWSSVRVAEAAVIACSFSHTRWNATAHGSLHRRRFPNSGLSRAAAVQHVNCYPLPFLTSGLGGCRTWHGEEKKTSCTTARGCTRRDSWMARREAGSKEHNRDHEFDEIEVETEHGPANSDRAPLLTGSPDFTLLI